jgi:hypothetical protein
MEIPKVKYTLPKQEVDRLFILRDDIHKQHLATTSYAEHKALNSFYDELLGLIDRFAETYQGKNGRLYESKDALSMIKQSKSKLQEFILQFKQDKDLENIIAEMIELHNSTEYLLSLK